MKSVRFKQSFSGAGYTIESRQVLSVEQLHGYGWNDSHIAAVIANDWAEPVVEEPAITEPDTSDDDTQLEGEVTAEAAQAAPKTDKPKSKKKPKK